MDLVITVAAFLLVLLLGAFVIARHQGRPGLHRSVLRRMAPPEAPSGDDILRTGRRRNREAATRILARLMRIDLLQRLEQIMWQAGIYAPVADILLLIVLLAGAGIIGGGAISDEPLLALGLGVAMGVLPLLYIKVRRQRRLKAFALQLPYALDLIKSSIEAGHSLLRGFQVVVAEFGDPIGGEFRSVIEQSRLGLPLPRALEEMLERVPVEDLRLLVVAVRVQSEVGSSLAQIVGRLSEIVRTRQRIQQQIRALTAQSRMSGMVVGFLPIVMLAAFSVIQPAYVHTLFYDPSGRTILKIAAGLDIMAFVTIRKLLKVEF
ncbi:MAG TPA: type II secretion system F family protein [Candidatus Binataceae bacterium]|nr:type II secretion system F family protein [Candidatus Binataceae bacterium]